MPVVVPVVLLHSHPRNPAEIEALWQLTRVQAEAHQKEWHPVSNSCLPYRPRRNLRLISLLNKEGPHFCGFLHVPRFEQGKRSRSFQHDVPQVTSEHAKTRVAARLQARPFRAEPILSMPVAARDVRDEGWWKYRGNALQHVAHKLPGNQHSTLRRSKKAFTF